jgi:flagellar hook-associated protein 3 FlgL
MKAQGQLASMKRVNKPSDDPFATQKAISSRSQLMLLTQYKSNISEISTWSSATEQCLAGVNDCFQEVRNLVVSAASGTLGQQEREAIAGRIDEFRESVLEFANTQAAGRYLFSGSLTETEPFTWTGADVVYNGNADGMTRNIGPGASVRINVTGEEAFMGIGAPPTSSIKMLADIADAVRAGDVGTIGGYLTGVDAVLDRVLGKMGEVGATASRLEKMTTVLDGFVLSRQKELSEAEDLDIAEGIMNLQVRDNAYQAALAACARIITPSLIDYLR